jgi:hypothetical protein
MALLLAPAWRSAQVWWRICLFMQNKVGFRQTIKSGIPAPHYPFLRWRTCSVPFLPARELPATATTLKYLEQDEFHWGPTFKFWFNFFLSSFIDVLAYYSCTRGTLWHLPSSYNKLSLPPFLEQFQQVSLSHFLTWMHNTSTIFTPPHSLSLCHTTHWPSFTFLSFFLEKQILFVYDGYTGSFTVTLPYYIYVSYPELFHRLHFKSGSLKQEKP